MKKEIKDRLDLIRNLTDRRREALLERGDTKLYDIFNKYFDCTN